MGENENISSDADVSVETGDEPTSIAETVDESVDLSGLETLQAELEAARSEVAAANDKVLRAHAEADNVRKRAERDVIAAHKFGLERFIGALLPVKDSIDLGFNALDVTTDVEAIKEGMALTAKMLDDALEKSGVAAIDPVGEAFNPDFHQAVTMQPSSEVAPGTVLSCMQKGYVLNERLIRPAMVVVAKALEQ
ncbi:MAG: nucleotide exchange factor GrpE [Proteobacteria bacterium]|nr:nucleotide exchange factor GrpE [Pseudomonadota bacterium]